MKRVRHQFNRLGPSAKDEPRTAQSSPIGNRTASLPKYHAYEPVFEPTHRNLTWLSCGAEAP